MKKLVYFLLLLTAVNIVVGVYMLTRQKPVLERSDTVEVVRYDTIRDTMPVVRTETKKYYIKIPDTLLLHDTVTGEVTMPVVQRMYTDDTTYRAYISGVRIEDYPRLDSIMVRQRTIERTITNTVTKKKHWRIGVGVNAGVSLTTGKPDIQAGIFGGYTF